MRDYLLVFLGGGVGSILRFSLSKWVMPFTSGLALGTLLANVLSSFLLGCVLGLLQSRAGWGAILQPLVITGICGGFSTFSTFGNDTLQLFRTENSYLAITNILVNVVLCISVILIGERLGKII